MGETDLRRGARWLALIVAVLGLAAAAALAAPPQGNFTVTPNTPNQGEPALFTCKPCPGKAEVAWDLDGVPGSRRAAVRPPPPSTAPDRTW